MVKSFAASTLAAAAVFGMVLVSVGACSDSSDGSKFGEDTPKPDAESDAVGPLLGETGAPDAKGEGGTGTCTAKIPDNFKPTWKAPTKAAGACTAAELKMYWDSCLADAGKTESDGTCAKFKTDHASCGACAEPDDKSGPIQWQLSREFYTLNIAGCIAVTQTGTDAGASGCGEAYNAAVQCSRESCITCITEAQDFNLFNQCQKGVGMKGICKSYETAQGAACTGYKDAGSPALTCFPADSESQESFFTRVVSVTCGP